MKEMIALSEAPSHINPFIPLFETCYRLVGLGYDTDLTLNNIFLDNDGKTLGLVDQTSFPIHKPPEKSRFDSYVSCNVEQIVEELSESLTKADIPELNKLESLLYKAKDHVISAHAQDAPHAKPKLSFANVSDVKAISLDDPPHVLVETLRELHKRTNTAARS